MLANCQKNSEPKPVNTAPEILVTKVLQFWLLELSQTFLVEEKSSLFFSSSRCSNIPIPRCLMITPAQRHSSFSLCVNVDEVPRSQFCIYSHNLRAQVREGEAREKYRLGQQRPFILFKIFLPTTQNEGQPVA